MAEHELELRLRAVARTLDADAPALDPAGLGVAGRRRGRGTFLALAAAVVLLAGVAAAPAAVSALGDFFGVESVPELGPVAADVAPAYLGLETTPSVAEAAVPFPVRTIASLGAPDAAYVRVDVAGGMVTLAYDGGGTLLTQWPAARLRTSVAVVPVAGTADEVAVGSLRALWLAGAARGTFTLTGADGAIHKELFDVTAGALLWQDGDAAFLLQGAGTKERAVQLAATVGP